MKITFRKLLDFSSAVNTIFEQNPGIGETKFGYSVKRFNDKHTVPEFKKYNSEMELIRIDHALTDEKTKAILMDSKSGRGFAYDKEGLKAVIRAEQAFTEEYNAKEIEVEPCITKEIPDYLSLNDFQKETLEGLVIEPTEEGKTE